MSRVRAAVQAKSSKMGRPRSFDTEAALETALDLFWTYGYDGVTSIMLAKAMNINRPSLHAAFGTKDDLFRTVLQRYIAKPAAYVEAALAIPDTKTAVRALLEGAARTTTADAERRGCLMIMGAAIGPPESEAMRRELAAMRAKAEKALTERLTRGQKKGDLSSKADPAQIASYLVTLNYGNALRAKEGKTAQDLQHTIDLAMDAIPFVDTGQFPPRHFVW